MTRSNQSESGSIRASMQVPLHGSGAVPHLRQILPQTLHLLCLVPAGHALRLAARKDLPRGGRGALPLAGRRAGHEPGLGGLPEPCVEACHGRPGLRFARPPRHVLRGEASGGKAHFDEHGRRLCRHDLSRRALQGRQGDPLLLLWEKENSPHPLCQGAEGELPPTFPK